MSPYVENPLIIENQNAKGTAKYVALGDSLSAGVGSTDVKNTFVYIYAQKLSEKYQKVNILNLAQPGGTTVEVIDNQLQRAIGESPDYVTLLIGTNDMHNKVGLNTFKKDYEFILNELLTKTTAKITVMDVPYIGSNKLVYPPFNFLMDYRIKQFNKVISGVISKENSQRITFIPLYNETYNLPAKNPGYYSADLFHPSDAGYTLWGKIINAR